MDKPFWHSKTFWFGVVTVLVGAMDLVAKQFSIPADITLMVVGIGNLILRALTVQPVGFRLK